MLLSFHNHRRSLHMSPQNTGFNLGLKTLIPDNVKPATCWPPPKRRCVSKGSSISLYVGLSCYRYASGVRSIRPFDETAVGPLLHTRGVPWQRWGIRSRSPRVRARWLSGSSLAATRRRIGLDTSTPKTYVLGRTGKKWPKKRALVLKRGSSGFCSD